jgi:hypothetical protein
MPCGKKVIRINDIFLGRVATEVTASAPLPAKQAESLYLIVIPEQAFFAQRGIWADRAKRRVSLRRNNRAFGSLPF